MTKEEIILQEVCEYFKIMPSELFTKSRKREIVRPRQIFYYLCTEHTKLTLNRIGKIPGTHDKPIQDHATVLHARNTISADIWQNFEQTRDIVNLLSKYIKRKFRHNNVPSSIIKNYFSYLNGIEMEHFIVVTAKNEITYEKALTI